MQITNMPGFCAGRVIQALSSHASPEEAMIAFCARHRSYGNVMHLSAFYVFTAVIKDKTRGVGYRYGPAFAKFITDNGLGKITPSVKRVNRLNHPDHLDQVWVWAPSKDAVRKWWKANGGPNRGL